VEEEGWLALFGHSRVSIQPMLADEIGEFVARWHRAFERECRETRRTPPIPNAAKPLTDQILGTGALEQLAAIPLLCTAICYPNQAKVGQLPRSKRELLSELVRMLIHERDQKKLSPNEQKRFGHAFETMRFDDKLLLLERLARLSFDQDVERPDIEGVFALREVEEGLATLPPSARSLRSAEVLELLQERSGVLRGVGSDSIGFVHNLLRSWLAAGRFKEEEGRIPGFLRAAAAALDEDVVVLAAAVGSEKYRTRLVRSALDRAERSKDTGEARRLRLWALRGRETGAIADRDRKELDRRLAELEPELCRTLTMEEAAGMAELGERIVPHLRRRAEQSDSEAAAAVRCLRLIAGEAAMNALSTYLDHQASAVVLELVQAQENPY
jgi:hypothetical protein